jgi:multiple sugar transport system ATP-binding protein
MVFVGPSGCGKSTLLRTIAGLEDITGGTLSIGGRVVNDVPPAERGIAMVFQSYALYPHMNLFDNMAFGLKLAKVPKAEIDAAVHQAAKILHIEHLLSASPRTCRAASASAWPSAAPSCASPRSSCSTSRSPTWTPRCA